ncbi:MAG: MotA/TolQ/ExbB proton channel family protein [Calditrichaeota bacterium]|nr:MotA/TolQ/ExbB proton channel family protein [Candidatus Cloacimonadota bacterium]MCA9786075.1 MotA/TolQ/ExbB proton channel family protein [Candidatus Cloacimonadota bacterium]MCB1046105.1 MotA/TolQ/ExbB proton channel family protein [Calditrichota bacterium]MCB9473357.1 MotA/TolQ/ExbB proton channel family protein [Candidatus Delongbacteria bacterium]
MTVLVKLLSQFSPSNDGAFFFWILAIFGLLAFSLAIERLLTVNIKSNIDAEKFSSDVRAMIQKGDLKNAHELAKANSEKALAYVYSRALQVAVGMEYIDYRNIQNAVDEATLEIMPRLTKRTSWLQTFANVATLIGLMGTIYGLILSFEALASAGAGSSNALAAGISTAMLTTLAGLMVAIPCMLCFSLINNKTNQIMAEIDEYSVKLINLITGSK